jgi:hypothetical protein
VKCSNDKPPRCSQHSHVNCNTWLSKTFTLSCLTGLKSTQLHWLSTTVKTYSKNKTEAWNQLLTELIFWYNDISFTSDTSGVFKLLQCCIFKGLYLVGTAVLVEYMEPSVGHQEEPYQGVLPSYMGACVMVVLVAAGIHSELPLVNDSYELDHFHLTDHWKGGEASECSAGLWTCNVMKCYYTKNAKELVLYSFSAFPMTSLWGSLAILTHFCSYQILMKCTALISFLILHPWHLLHKPKWVKNYEVTCFPPT